LHVINLANEGCKALGIKDPRIAVAGLNPHAGEYDYRDPEGSPGGIFGDEEQKEIIPAVKAAQELGINAVGPIPGDTVYASAVGGKFDIVVSMFHDQGHIPMKLRGFVYNEKTKDFDSINGVNTTIGLPIIRTSVDHGTAFGKAGKGTANCDSLKQALQSAVRLAKSGYYDNGFQAS
jgi:4-hydroxythreonine-4-phosphate dehydrogenase